MIDICLGTREMRNIPKDTIKKIDAIAKAAVPTDYEDWKLSMAPWSTTRGWRWLEDDVDKTLSFPVYMEGCKGPLCRRLKKDLPNNSLGEATAVYVFLKDIWPHLVPPETGDYITWEPHVGNGLDWVDDDQFVFTLYKFSAEERPIPIDIDLLEIIRKREVLADIFPIEPGFYTQSIFL
jgi:hypothetical protein